MKIENYLPPQFVISGTDTGVGKSVVAAMLAAGLRSLYWKPLQSGLIDGTDTEAVRDISGLAPDFFLPEAYRLQAAISPHASAALEGLTIERSRLCLPAVEGRLIIEGVGGLMVPINDQSLFIDVIKDWGLPLLLVARSRLGTINHTLLSLAALSSYKIDVLGVVMNGGGDEVSRRAIETYGKVRVLTEIPFLPALTPTGIKSAYERLFAGVDF